MLLRDLPSRIDPFDPANVLILATGLLTGAPLATATRFTAAAKSPLTGAYGESEAGGFWGPELKMIGYEAIEITGRAPSPVYLALVDGQAAIRDAGHLWGQEPDWVEKQIRAELGSDKARILQIGLAGENLVRYAGMTHELRHYNGRNGIGAVMGSKNLKAVAVRSTSGRYTDNAVHPQELLNLGKQFSQETKNHPQSWDLHEKGTLALVSGFNAAGILPTKNFQSGYFAGADQINWEAIDRHILSGHRSCYACSVRCKPEVRSDGKYELNQAYGGPEYEAVAGFGSNCGVDDPVVVAKANELCNRYVMDTISTSATIAFAMECFERGLIGLEDTGGLELKFGNAGAMLRAVEWIARRQGFGDLLAEGSYRAAQKIGGNALDYAIQVKGQELSMHEPARQGGSGSGFCRVRDRRRSPGLNPRPRPAKSRFRILQRRSGDRDQQSPAGALIERRKGEPVFPYGELGQPGKSARAMLFWSSPTLLYAGMGCRYRCPGSQRLEYQPAGVATDRGASHQPGEGVQRSGRFHPSR